MINFFGLSSNACALLLSGYLVLSICQFFVFIFKAFRSSNIIAIIIDGLYSLAMFVISVSLLAEKRGATLILVDKIPVFVYILPLVIEAIRLIVFFISLRKNSDERLSKFSVIDAINSLPMGIMFTNPNGKIMLSNEKINQLVFDIIGVYPQILSQLNFSNVNENQVKILNSDKYIFKLTNGEIWQFKTFDLLDEDLKGWKQTVAQNITNVYNYNVLLENSNNELKEVNNKLQDMYDKMADTIREKETLELKVYIHDTMGRSLLNIHDILEQSDKEDVDIKVSTLQDVLSSLSSNRLSSFNTIEEVVANAKKIGVNINISGEYPLDENVRDIVVSATRESVTNCVKHANGSEIYLDLKENDGIFTIEITNNGKKPTGEIIEGSGLSSLRKKVNAVGGNMIIEPHPIFKLTITI